MILLLPICLGFVLPAMYLGGWARDVTGGKPALQLIGLVLSIVLFNVVWGVLHRIFQGVAGPLGWLVLPTTIAVLLFPAIAQLSFRLWGVRIVRKAAGH